MILLALIVLLVTAVALVATREDRRKSAANTDRIPILSSRGCGCVLLLLLLLFLAGIALNPIGGRHHRVESAAMQTCRTIALAMFQYANDNGAYPDGSSSTQVFQKLLDGHYLTDPGVLYLPMPGKTRAEGGAKLRPENVCYDVTSGIAMDSPDMLPIVFSTGFRIVYERNGDAVSLIKPLPGYDESANSWFSFPAVVQFDGIAVAYKNNNAYFKQSVVHSTLNVPVTNYPNGFHLITNIVSFPKLNAEGFGVVPDVVSSDFDPKGKTYRQLTPDGPLK